LKKIGEKKVKRKDNLTIRVFLCLDVIFFFGMSEALQVSNASSFTLGVTYFVIMQCLGFKKMKKQSSEFKIL